MKKILEEDIKTNIERNKKIIRLKLGILLLLLHLMYGCYASH